MCAPTVPLEKQDTPDDEDGKANSVGKTTPHADGVGNEGSGTVPPFPGIPGMNAARCVSNKGGACVIVVAAVRAGEKKYSRAWLHVYGAVRHDVRMRRLAGIICCASVRHGEHLWQYKTL